MAIEPNDVLVNLLRSTIIGLVRDEQKDLTTRQLGIFLRCYLVDGPHTVRGLALDLKVPRPSITRALDRLEAMDLARRKRDDKDRRSVLVVRTVEGTAFLRALRASMIEAARAGKSPAAPKSLVAG